MAHRIKSALAGMRRARSIRPPRAWFGGVVFVLLTTSVGGDVLVLKSGRSIEGHYLGRDGRQVRFDTIDGPVAIDREQVADLVIQTMPVPLCYVRASDSAETCGRRLLRIEPDALIMIEGDDPGAAESRLPTSDLSAWRASRTNWNQRIGRLTSPATQVIVETLDGAVSGTIVESDGLTLQLRLPSGERVRIAEKHVVALSMASGASPAASGDGTTASAAPATFAAERSRRPPAQPLTEASSSQPRDALDFLPVYAQLRRNQSGRAALLALGFTGAVYGWFDGVRGARAAARAAEGDPAFILLGVSPHIDDYNRMQAQQRTFGWTVLALYGMHLASVLLDDPPRQWSRLDAHAPADVRGLNFMQATNAQEVRTLLSYSISF